MRRFGDEQFAGEGGPLLLAGNALHTDLPPEGAGSAVYGWLLAMLGQTVGFPVPVGGSSSLVDALVNRLNARGGELRLNAPVERVLIESGRAVGVRLAGGDAVRAGRAVLADTSAPALYHSLVGTEHLPARLVRDLDKFQWDARTIKINWALSAPIPWTAAGARGAGTVHLGVDMDGLTFYAAALAARQVPPRPFILVGQMTTSDPTRSPSGTESAWAYTHLPDKIELSELDIAIHVERIEQAIEHHAPGFTGLILDRQVQSPSDMQHDDANLVGGAINGGTAALYQQLVFRPVPGLARAETVIDGLYLASAPPIPAAGCTAAQGTTPRSLRCRGPARWVRHAVVSWSSQCAVSTGTDYGAVCSEDPGGPGDGRFSAMDASRSSDSMLRRRSSASWTGLCNHLPGPSVGASAMHTRDPSPSGSTVSTILASPIGQARACSTRRRGGSDSTTAVLSLTTSGQAPTWWCSSAPTAGQFPSTSRMCVAPTTQPVYIQPSANSAHTFAGGAAMCLLTSATHQSCPQGAAGSHPPRHRPDWTHPYRVSMMSRTVARAPGTAQCRPTSDLDGG